MPEQVEAAMPFSVGGELGPNLTLSPGPRPTSVPSVILKHPASWHKRHGPKSVGAMLLSVGESWEPI